MKTDEVRFEILEDGTISTETDQISGQNHQSADQLMDELVEMTGGPVSITKRKGGKRHHHHHTHGHDHKHQH